MDCCCKKILSDAPHHIIEIYYLCLYQSLEKGEGDQWMDISRNGETNYYMTPGAEREH